MEKGLWIALSFPFLLPSSFQCKCLACHEKVMCVRKDTVVLHWSFMFLRMPLPSLYVPSKFWFQWKKWRLGALPPLTAMWRHHILALYLLWVLLNSHMWWAHQKSLLKGHHKCSMQRGRQRVATRTLHMSPAHTRSIIPLDFTYKTQIQRQNIKNFCVVTGEH